MTSIRQKIDLMNGWQRLWVIFSILAAIVIAAVTALTWPSEPELIVWDTAPGTPVPVHDLPKELGGKGGSAQTAPANAFEDLIPKTNASKPAFDPDAYLASKPKVAPDKQRFDPSTARPMSEQEEFEMRALQERKAAAAALAAKVAHEEKLRIRSEQRVSAVLHAIAWWLAIVTGAYALGWSFAWVRAGFRRNT